jgi:hypothetical protein
MLIFDRCMYQITSEATADTPSVGRLQGWLKRRGQRQQSATKECGGTGAQEAPVKASGRLDTTLVARAE